jgi:mRNA-degrading endonuclease RelE of RelBE toxin-antitoxin system
MSEDAAPSRIAVTWSPEARADVRAIASEPAMQILRCIDRYLATRAGDVKRLKAPLAGCRLRCGDYRVFFDQGGDNTIEITAIRNRRDAYQ